MDDYLLNTLFVEDLLEYLFATVGIQWKAKKGVHFFKHRLGKSLFDPIIGMAVNKLCEVFHIQLEESSNMLIDLGITNEADFSKYALAEATECFSLGYTHEHFLAYCVQVLGISGMYYYPDIDNVVDSAAQVVALVLFSHQMTGEFKKLGGWKGLTEVARTFSDRLPWCDDTDDEEIDDKFRNFSKSKKPVINKNTKMDTSLGAWLFAEDLMKYVFEKCDCMYAPRAASELGKFREQIGTSPFRVVIGNAICSRIEEDLEEFTIMFEKEFKTLLDATVIKTRMMKIAPRWFPEGYHPTSFIEFCCMVSSTSLSYHETGHHHISYFAHEVIAAVLTEHIVSNEFREKGGWEELIRVCTHIDKCARAKYLRT